MKESENIKKDGSKLIKKMQEAVMDPTAAAEGEGAAQVIMDPTAAAAQAEGVKSSSSSGSNSSRRRRTNKSNRSSDGVLE